MNTLNNGLFLKIIGDTSDMLDSQLFAKYLKIFSSIGWAINNFHGTYILLPICLVSLLPDYGQIGLELLSFAHKMHFLVTFLLSASKLPLILFWKVPWAHPVEVCDIPGCLCQQVRVLDVIEPLHAFVLLLVAIFLLHPHSHVSLGIVFYLYFFVSPAAPSPPSSC